MKILFLTPQLPYPPRKGGTIRAYNFIKCLAPRHEVSVLSLAAPGGGDAAALGAYCQRVETVPLPARSVLGRLLTVAGSPHPDMHWRLASQEYEERLRLLLAQESFHIVQVESLEMARYWLAVGAARPGPRAVLDELNAEYLLQERAFHTDRRHPRRWPGALYSLIQWQKLRRYEAAACRAFDGVIAVSEPDRAALQRLAPGLRVAVVPHGVDTAYFRPLARENPPSQLVFCGTMDFRPNVDAALWFHQEIWPLVRRQVPEAWFAIVGANPTAAVRRLARAPGVLVTGEVEDTRPYLAESWACVVPLRFGAGARLKVLEAMAMGVPVVSTSMGAEGLEVEPERHLLVADQPLAFAQALLRLHQDPQLRRRLATEARRLAEEKYDWQKIAPRLEQLYHEILIPSIY